MLFQSIRNSVRRSVLAVAFLGALNPLSGFADENAEKSESPYMQITSGEAGSFPLSGTDVQVSLNGGIAHVRVEQRYKNSGSTPIEAVYVFPASTRAAVHRMAMTVADRTIEAKVKEKDEARAEYERAKQNGTTAALVEQERPNVFTANVGNILPGDAVSVVLEFTEKVSAEKGIYEYVYPSVVGPRYSNSAPSTGRWITNPYLAPTESIKVTPTFHLSAQLDSAVTISKAHSPSHQIAANFAGPNKASIELNDSTAANRDFVLEYVLGDAKIESGVTLHRREGENFFLLQVEPPKRIAAEDVVARELIFIVDVSGSMDGFPIEVSKKLMQNLLTNLRPIDSFNVVLFAGSSSRMNETSLPATAENIASARKFVSERAAGGGTELISALRDSMSIPRSEGTSRSFVILTDGFVTVEPEAFTMIRDNLGDANFFPFGIGTSVNRYLIEGIAKAGKAESFVVLSEAEALAKAQRFQELVRSPLMTDIKVSTESSGGLEIFDIEPASIPDLLGERPLAIVGKFKGEGAGKLVVTGRSGSGEFRSTFDLAKVDTAKQNSPALPYLWARERIARLSDYAGLESDRKMKAEVIELGLRYNLLTQFTSFVAVDTVARRTSQPATTVQQPLPLPQGVSSHATSNFWSAPSGYRRSASGKADGGITYNDGKITNSVNAVLLYVEGSLGALVMAVFGIGAIMFLALSVPLKKRSLRYSGYAMLAIAVGAFALRSLMSTFFNDSFPT